MEYYSLCLSILLVQSTFAGYVDAPEFFHLTGRLEATSTHDSTQVLIQDDGSTMDLDSLYRSVLKTHQRAETVWRQQPGNPAALRSILEEVANDLRALRSISRDSSATSKRPRSKKAPVTEGNAQAPSGPVRPSQAPSSEEEVRKRREATLERFPSAGPIGDSPKHVTLEGVPASWIAHSIERTMKELAKLNHLLNFEDPDQDAVNDSLRNLGTFLCRFGSPPPDTPQVTPRN